MYRGIVLVLCLAAFASATWVNTTHFFANGVASPATFQLWAQPALAPYYLEVKVQFREVSDLYTLQFSGNPVSFVQKDKVLSDTVVLQNQYASAPFWTPSSLSCGYVSGMISTNGAAPVHPISITISLKISSPVAPAEGCPAAPLSGTSSVGVSGLSGALIAVIVVAAVFSFLVVIRAAIRCVCRRRCCSSQAACQAAPNAAAQYFIPVQVEGSALPGNTQYVQLVPV